MKLTLLALAAVAFAPSLASAHGHHHHHGHHAHSVQHMTCAQAQSMVAAHGMYYKYTGTGDLVPMYPVHSEAPACNGYGYGSSSGRLNYVFEATLDDGNCFLGYRCTNR